MAMISDSDIQALITPEIRREVIEEITKKSAVLGHFTRLNDMSTSETELRILDALPVSYWVSGNTGFKKTTNLEWANKRIIAQELATIVPISINSIRDSAIDVWETVKRNVVQDMHKKIDAAIITGEDKPAMFRASLIDTIINAGATVTTTSNFLSDTDAAMAKVESSGYIPSAIMGGVGMRSELRRIVDSTGQPINATWLDGLEKIYVENSSWDSNKAKYIVGDFKKCVYAIRQDIEFEIFTQGVVSDPETGKIVYNLMQQDMIAARCTMRLGWEVPNPVNILQPDPLVRFPLALVLPTNEVTTYDVTFNVTDGTSPIENAKINMGGIRTKTNAQGIAIIKSQGNKSYSYTVKSENKDDVRGKVSILQENVAVNVVMN